MLFREEIFQPRVWFYIMHILFSTRLLSTFNRPLAVYIDNLYHRSMLKASALPMVFLRSTCMYSCCICNHIFSCILLASRSKSGLQSAFFSGDGENVESLCSYTRKVKRLKLLGAEFAIKNHLYMYAIRDTL